MATQKNNDDGVKQAIATNTKNKGGIIIAVTLIICVIAFFVIKKNKHKFLK